MNNTELNPQKPARPWFARVGLAAAGLALGLLTVVILKPAFADSDEHEGREGKGNMSAMARMPAVVKQECAACHMAYPPSMLPAASWTQIMSTLDKHYGSDASLDPKSVQEISQWLLRYAGTQRVQPPDNRITKSAWFIHEHDEVPRGVWSRPSIKSASNCIACHGTQANQGNFDEDNIRIPRS